MELGFVAVGVVILGTMIWVVNKTFFQKELDPISEGSRIRKEKVMLVSLLIFLALFWFIVIKTGALR